MEAGAARPVAVADGHAHRPREAQDRARRPPAQPREGRGARNAVGRQARPVLEAHQRAEPARAEHAIDGAEREAVRLEQELQRRDVPTAVAAADRAPAERRPSAAAERAAGGRPCDAVDDQPAARLEAADGGARARPGDAVDRAAVEAARVQRHLQRRGSGARLCGLGREAREHRENGERCEATRHRATMPDPEIAGPRCTRSPRRAQPEGRTRSGAPSRQAAMSSSASP
jgi:hypothetical protein